MLRSLRGQRQLDWLAARSSSIGEDGVAASFAGQHLARLAVPPDRLAPAMAEVARCATTQSAASCRSRLDLARRPRWPSSSKP